MLRYILLCILLFPLPALSAEKVIVLHGIARDSSSVKKLANYLEEQGYEVHNTDYPSTDKPIGELVDILYEKVSPILEDHTNKVHFVGYSMGCIMIRALIAKYNPKNLGRVVMIAPPNKGSEASDLWKDNILYQAIFGPAGQELVTDESSVVNKLPDANYELGIIAGDRSVDPLSSAVIPGKDDGKVAIENTKIPGMNDHIVIHASHSFIMNKDEALKQTAHFLKNGVFDHENKN